MDHISNADKPFFPDAGFTKRDVVEYYGRIADVMLPHVAGRPLVLERFPDGIDHDGFFQKNAPDSLPLERIAIGKADGGTTDYAVARGADDLATLADRGAIVVHTLLCDADDPDRPVEVVFDLDPADDDLGPVRRTARALRDVLDDLGLAPRVKSSGSRGLHVVVDVVDEDADFDLTKAFARAVAHRIADELDEVTVEQRKDRRGGRLFLDVLRNSSANHAVAPYSLRALPGAPVAVPLDWDEALSSDFDPQRITLDNVFRRLGQRDDPWRAAPSATRTVAAARSTLQED